MKLVKLFDEGLIWHGVTADICTGDNYADAQKLAATLYASNPDLDGIAYRARHDNGQICYALFDRVSASDLQFINDRQFVNEHAINDTLMRRYNASWDPMTPFSPP